MLGQLFIVGQLSEKKYLSRAGSKSKKFVRMVPKKFWQSHEFPPEKMTPRLGGLFDELVHKLGNGIVRNKLSISTKKGMNGEVPF